MRSLPAVLLLCLAAAPAPAEETREKVLDNGLTVLVRRMAGAPLVTVLTAYRVGSANELSGQTGITHILEHMLFKGSAKYPDGEVARRTEEVGGYMNGYTSTDAITFYQTVPSACLGEFLDRHADAMENATLSPEDLAKEMVVVRSELEGDEGDPAEHLRQALDATAFTAHGLSWPIIGWRHDVEHVGIDDLRAWYVRCFRPNNAIVVVVGDVDPDAALAEVEKRFAPLEAGDRPPEPTPEPPQAGERRVFVRRPAAAPLVMAAWHVPPVGHPDSFALEVAQNVLGNGRSSRLSRALVDKGLATEVSASNEWSRFPALFRVTAVAAPEADPEAVEEAVLAETYRLMEQAPSPAEVARAVRQIERASAFWLDTTEEVASALADFEVYCTHRYAFAFAAEAAKVTPERVQAVARQYFDEDNRTVGLLLPALAAAGLDLRGAAAEIDRAPASPAPPAAAAAAKPPQEFTLGNGLRVLVWESRTTDTVSAVLRWPGGRARDGSSPGLANLTLAMLGEGTTARDRDAWHAALEDAGYAHTQYAGAEYTEVALTGQAAGFPAALALAGEALREPRFAEETFALVRERVAGETEQEREDGRAMAHRAVAHYLFPPGHPRFRPMLEAEVESVRGLALEDVRAFHAAFGRPGAAVLAVAGAVDLETVRKAAEASFGAWPAGEPVAPLAFPAPLEDTVHGAMVLLPGLSEADCVVAVPCALRRDSPDWPTFEIANYILGYGSVFTSRLGRVVRVENGLAYDVFSDLSATLGNGYFWVEFGTAPENDVHATLLVRDVLARAVTEGFTEAEVRTAIGNRVTSLALRTETAEAKAAALADAAWFGLGADYPLRRAEEYRRVTVEAVNAAFRKYVDPRRAVDAVAEPPAKEND